MTCQRPCYVEPTFNYPGMACFLKDNMKYSNTGMKVLVMIKDKYNPGIYKYIEKPVIYFIPNDPLNSSTIVSYVAPGHDNSYNYMYLLAKRLNGGNHFFSGDHFTMGLRNGQQFDLHYTSYDYTANSRPNYLYYNVHVGTNTSPRDITTLVCSKTMHNKPNYNDDTLAQRCYFFDNLMKFTHDTYCTTFRSKFTASAPYMSGGKLKRQSKKDKKKDKQFGGNDEFGGYDEREIKNVDDIDEPFRSLVKHLESKINDIPKLYSIEMHIMNDSKGILTYCIDDENVETTCIRVDGITEQTGKFMRYYALPFDFQTYEFISIENLVQSLDKSIQVTNNNIRIPLQGIAICDNNFSYSNIIEMTKYPMSIRKNCKNVGSPNVVFRHVSIPVSAGGKKKKLPKKKGV